MQRKAKLASGAEKVGADKVLLQLLPEGLPPDFLARD